ncbi:nucleotide-binding universal stress UspA family protein [Brevibacterium sanguinis]|uniref:Nucleotide-binding universal stress UspA family protein n=2 Tax=Brevibacterium TaxID=1696 RepID=A0A366IMT5_9MICO|nr:MULTISPECIES: universal stress protein [Brevibacterium]RBP68208.1 nucleotide-binding universal stress UspA family protein [Brevibacterium sanguinis]RBP74375.1 nucleotide-binding universal stress UspA family protein [Brevibacterium celere]
MSHESPSTIETVPFHANRREAGVLVGYDGSDNAGRALEYAAGLALRRGIRLTVATAYKVPVMIYTTLAALPHEPEDEARRKEAVIVLDHARRLLEGYPGEVDYRLAEGDSVGALVGLSEHAQLAVVGARGRGGFLGRVLGSVASALPAHAKCPTIVLDASPDGTDEQAANRSDAQAESADAQAGSAGVAGKSFALPHSQAPVVAGIDGSPQARTAVLQAALAAVEAETSLHLLMALPPLDDPLVWYPELVVDYKDLTDRRRGELERSLGAEIAWIEGHFRTLNVDGSVKVGDPVAILREATRTAQLTVVGSRGRGAIKSVLLGSTSRDLLHHAEGPVMVVPPLADERLEDQPSAV